MVAYTCNSVAEETGTGRFLQVLWLASPAYLTSSSSVRDPSSKSNRTNKDLKVDSFWGMIPEADLWLLMPFSLSLHLQAHTWNLLYQDLLFCFSLLEELLTSHRHYNPHHWVSEVILISFILSILECLLPKFLIWRNILQAVINYLRLSGWEWWCPCLVLVTCETEAKTSLCPP